MKYIELDLVPLITATNRLNIISLGDVKGKCCSSCRFEIFGKGVKMRVLGNRLIRVIYAYTAYKCKSIPT